MKVKNWMVKDIITISPQASISAAVELMHQHSIRHLPVVEDDSMQGLVTESNLRQYFFPSMVHELSISDVMIVNPITVDPNTSIDSAAQLIHKYKIGGLPVLEKRQLIGMLTITDILAAFIQLFGLLKESSRLDITLSEKGGTLDDVLRLIREMGGKVISVGVEALTSKKKIYYIRLEKGELSSIVRALEDEDHKVVSILD
ncbi:MAG: CBS domain-containing protein [Deltaproteobacteria bacterium]|nr:CBS domain-containing protein [Deltaproteobacteria bacterium]MBW1718387.1 CBS domain-containing protein [Deltaproteobacteria bacterium]MBW1937402.1 CBS domain-containing protein [Deltaproteobacteria bacterium]MBW1964088.1 CBS domain-containing protein [Deltaproteobacteria bacterium]MBW2080363.1 CBS domain-containing protein [Deltaproteobacteria bacterium]